MGAVADTLQAQIASLAAQGHADRHIARVLGITRHAAREGIFRAKLGNGQDHSLTRYDLARRALAEAKTFDEVREWEDKAAAIREYSRRVKDRGMEMDAWEIRERARRRRGELLHELKLTGELSQGDHEVTERGPRELTLDDLGITKNESSQAQKIAKLDGDSFERLVARCRAYAQSHPEKHAFDVLRAPDLPINGARSVMGSRQEPDDSLDWFPTPPWATRALVHHVMPELGFAGKRFASVWEPACGEGHMAEPLREYADKVLASDIFEYGYGKVVDFLTCDETADWIITNPPFGKKTEQFVLRALELADIGVAMFVRLQWLETIGRYERLFRDRPPTLIAFFCERVNLCKGRWEPDGDTATAYIWLVWIKGQEPQPPFWIPPGCREALTHPDDAERFGEVSTGETEEGEPHGNDLRTDQADSG